MICLLSLDILHEIAHGFQIIDSWDIRPIEFSLFMRAVFAHSAANLENLKIEGHMKSKCKELIYATDFEQQLTSS